MRKRPADITYTESFLGVGKRVREAKREEVQRQWQRQRGQTELPPQREGTRMRVGRVCLFKDQGSLLAQRDGKVTRGGARSVWVTVFLSFLLKGER